MTYFFLLFLDSSTEGKVHTIGKSDRHRRRGTDFNIRREENRDEFVILTSFKSLSGMTMVSIPDGFTLSVSSEE